MRYYWISICMPEWICQNQRHFCRKIGEFLEWNCFRKWTPWYYFAASCFCQCSSSSLLYYISLILSGAIISKRNNTELNLISLPILDWGETRGELIHWWNWSHGRACAQFCEKKRVLDRISCQSVYGLIRAANSHHHHGFHNCSHGCGLWVQQQWYHYNQ